MYSKTRTVIRTISVLSLISLILLTTSCATLVMNDSSSKPGKSSSAPGQVKKTTGSKSAKPYAPGQQKKEKLIHHFPEDQTLTMGLI